MENKKIVAITGASGFVDTHLVRFLSDKGYLIRVLIHQTRGNLNKDLEAIKGSIYDRESIKKLVKDSHTVFHLASALGMKQISEKEFYNINVKGTQTLLEEAVKAKVKKIVLFSSAGVYGKNTGTIPLKEDDNLNPVDIYEKTKKLAEEKALSFKNQINLTIIRPGWVFGEGDRRTFKLIKQIRSGWFFMVGSGKKKHSPIYVQDLLKGCFAASLREKSGEVFNMGGESLQIKEMCEIISSSLGKKPLPLKIPTFLIYPLVFCLEMVFKLFKKEALLTRAKLAFFRRGKPINSQKAIEELGFFESDTFANHLKKTINWYETNNWW